MKILLSFPRRLESHDNSYAGQGEVEILQPSLRRRSLKQSGINIIYAWIASGFAFAMTAAVLTINQKKAKQS